MKFLSNILLEKNLTSKCFFGKNLFRKKNFLGTLFMKFSFHEKIGFLNFLILNSFSFKRNNFSEF